MLVERGEAHVYDFAANVVPGRDRARPRLLARRGELDAYYDAHMDLVSLGAGVQPLQPRVADPHLARAAATGQVRVRRRRAGEPRVDSLVGPGVIVSGGAVRRSVLSPGVRGAPGARSTARC